MSPSVVSAHVYESSIAKVRGLVLEPGNLTERV